MSAQPDSNHFDATIRVDAPIDLSQLLRRCRGNHQLAHKVVVSFRQKIDEDIALLENALLRKDAEELIAVAHRVKGTAANVAADGLRQTAEEIERNARLGRFEQIQGSLIRFQDDGNRLARLVESGDIRFD